MTWGTPLSEMTVTSGYGPRKAPKAGASTLHAGTDYRAATGTVVHAVGSGTVTTSTTNSARGNYVVVDHGAGIATLYQHLSVRSVSVGQKVSAGQQVGLAGATGNVTGAHLHLEVHLNGKTTDPVPWLAAHVGKPQTTPAASDDGGALKLGSTGPRVEDLQEGLRRVFPGYKDVVDVRRGELLDIDGKFGPQTDAWFREWQRRAKAEGVYTGDVDGSCGPRSVAGLAHYGITL